MGEGAVGVACVGAGYWGKNLVRVFASLPGARLQAICDANAGIQGRMAAQYPGVSVCGDYGAVLADDAVQAVVLAVPAAGHYEAARAALEAGKHVYVEKPMTLDPDQARRLVDLAGERGLTLMVGHLLVHHPAVQLIKGLVDRGELGQVYYAYSQRVNLGIVRRDENAMWSLAPHDVAILLYLLGQEPRAVSARGGLYLQKGIEDVVFLTMHFGDGKMAEVHVSWLDPHKVRKLTLVGSRKMAVFDDGESAEKVRVYDKSAEREGYESYGESITLRFGDVTIPHINPAEPLKLECEHFLECVQTGQTPRSDGAQGLAVVRVLAAGQRSLENGGAPVEVNGG
ncbi:MAG: Gfo/Idh/MocA family oxidoreductase [Gemmatimonadota bacterium]